MSHWEVREQPYNEKGPRGTHPNTVTNSAQILDQPPTHTPAQQAPRALAKDDTWTEISTAAQGLSSNKTVNTLQMNLTESKVPTG